MTVAEKSASQACYPLDLFFCNQCTHLQLLDVVDPEELFRHYVYVSGTSPVFIAHFRDYARFMLDRAHLSPISTIVEIGSNDGTLLREFKNNGFNVLGIDPAQEIAATATSNGIETWPVFFSESLAERIVEERGQADIVIANNVMAHIDDLDQVARGIKRVLSQKGLFAFEVSYLLDVFEKTLFDTIYHEHLDYHSVKALRSFFARHNLELVDAIRVPTHGGSLRGLVQHAGGPHALNASVAELIAAEEAAGIDRCSTFKEFAQRVDQLGCDVRKLLQGLRAEGHSIAGFGAPAKATTLMYHFGIGPELIEYIIDDSPLKQGRFSPGLHVPVLSSDAIAERHPDYLVVLAWNFAESIIAKNQPYLQSGGRMIVPIPQLKVIDSLRPATN